MAAGIGIRARARASLNWPSPLTRVMFPFLLLVALSAQAMGILNALNQFGIPALSSTFFNIGSVAFGLAFGYTVGRWMGMSLVMSMAWGVVFGGAVQCCSRCPACIAPAFVYRLRVDFAHPGPAQHSAVDGAGDSGQCGGADQCRW